MIVRDIMLILHFLGIGMGVSTSIAMMIFGISASKMEKDAATSFMKKALTITRMGHWGLLFLIVSGGYLMNPYWSSLTEMPKLMGKLGAVVLLIVLVGVLTMRAAKFKRTGTYEDLMKIEQIGKITLPLTILIVVLAVLTFH